VFSLKVHPQHTWYTQCLDFRVGQNGQNDTRFYEIAFLCYQIFVSSITFFLPLIVIVFTYSGIIQKMITKLNTKSSGGGGVVSGANKRNKKSKKSTNAQDLSNNYLLFSKTRQDTMKKAKRKTLKLAITIGINLTIHKIPIF
jgi:hypothetical protein